MRSTLMAVALIAGLSGLAIGCTGASGTSKEADQSFLQSVHLAASDITTYRSDVQLERLGHAVCDGFRSGASYQGEADRIVLQEGGHPLPPQDLGAVMDAAVNNYCPSYRDRVS